jgi:predicted enzyme related to lactoylglutathione lyase
LPEDDGGAEVVSDVIEFRGIQIAQFQDPDGNLLQVREGPGA